MRSPGSPRSSLYEAYGYRRGTRVLDAFRRTWLLLVSGAVLLVGWSVFLASHGALDDWVFSYRAFIPGHRYTGGLPVEEGVLESFEAWAPIVALLAAFAFAAVFLRLSRPFVLDDWVVLGAASLTLLYYVKFVSRADAGHLAQVFAVATPFVLYVAYRLVVGLEAWLAGAVGSRGVRVVAEPAHGDAAGARRPAAHGAHEPGRRRPVGRLAPGGRRRARARARARRLRRRGRERRGS